MDLLADLRQLRADVRALGNRSALDALNHAYQCFLKGEANAGEAWLEMALRCLQ